MDRRTSPYAAHLFVCVNDRQGERKSCADEAAGALKDALKDGVRRRGWQERVRVSTSGCMGLCNLGPNVLVYPQGIWFSAVKAADIPSILDAVATVLAGG